MFSLFKLAFGMVVLAICGYAAFFVDLGDKPLAAHVSDVWTSGAVQEKVDLIKDKAKEEIGTRLADAAGHAGEELQDKLRGGGKPLEEISDADKKKLEELIGGK